MTGSEQRTFLAEQLRRAAGAFAVGSIGEKELIAISMAVNDALLEIPGDTPGQASFAPVGVQARAAMIERIAELDRGDA